MFEDKEEVQKAMMGLKLFGGMEDLAQNEEILDSTEEMVSQVNINNNERPFIQISLFHF